MGSGENYRVRHAIVAATVNHEPHSELTRSGKPSPTRRRLMHATTWLLAGVCFYLVFGKIQGAAAREQMTALDYLVRFIGDANWLAWLGIMIPYSCFFFWSMPT